MRQNNENPFFKQNKKVDNKKFKKILDSKR